MMRESDIYTEWDAAYLLGALSPDERWEYERHLADCPACSRSLAELAGLPSLLSLVPADQVVKTDGGVDDGRSPGGAGDEQEDAPRSWTRLREAVRVERRRTTRLVVSGLLLAAAAVVALALMLPAVLTPDVQAGSGSGAAITLSEVQPSALSADVRFVSEQWGTRIEATCIYARSASTSRPVAGYGSGGQGYALYVTDRSGETTEVASWVAAPGSTVEPIGTTSVAKNQIARIDIRSVASGDVLLSAHVGE